MKNVKTVFARIMLLFMLCSTLVPAMPAITNTPYTIAVEASYNRATIKKVQKALNKLGYDCGTPDGIAGKKTKAAIKEYQRDHDLKVTGTVNSTLLSSLKVKAVKDSASSNSSSRKKSSASTNDKSETVYITDTGSKYHRSGCRYLSRSSHSISRSDAKAQGYTPCSVCRP